MVTIKLIDYIADNMDVPEVTSNISEVCVVGDNIIRINNFDSICEYGEDMISVCLIHGKISLFGNNLSIDVITDRFLQISGKILNISFGEVSC